MNELSYWQIDLKLALEDWSSFIEGPYFTFQIIGWEYRCHHIARYIWMHLEYKFHYICNWWINKKFQVTESYFYWSIHLYLSTYSQLTEHRFVSFTVAYEISD